MIYYREAEQKDMENVAALHKQCFSAASIHRAYYLEYTNGFFSHIYQPRILIEENRRHFHLRHNAHSYLMAQVSIHFNLIP